VLLPLSGPLKNLDLLTAPNASRLSATQGSEAYGHWTYSMFSAFCNYTTLGEQPIYTCILAMNGLNNFNYQLSWLSCSTSSPWTDAQLAAYVCFVYSFPFARQQQHFEDTLVKTSVWPAIL